MEWYWIYRPLYPPIEKCLAVSSELDLKNIAQSWISPSFNSCVMFCYQIIFLKPNFTVRPVIVRPPQDTTALLGGEVSLECGVTGDPPPHVEWRRQDGAKIPINRIRPASNDQTRTSLRLERLVASDAGRYVCEVENSVGSSSASAQLAILIPVCTWIFHFTGGIHECFVRLIFIKTKNYAFGFVF